MKAILHFEEEERQELLGAIHSSDMVFLLEDIDKKIRECLKYQTTSPTQCLEDIRAEVNEMLATLDRR